MPVIERYEVVRNINGTWNVRDTSTGTWVRGGVWLDKQTAAHLAEALNAR